MTNNSFRPNINSLLDYINVLSNIETQKKFWLFGKGPEKFDFINTLLALRKHSVTISEEYKEKSISDTQLRLLMTLWGLLDYYNDTFLISSKYHTHELILLPEMIIIRSVAERVLLSFNHSSTPESQL